MTTTLFQDLMDLAQRIKHLSDELLAAAGQLIDIIKRYDDEMNDLGQTKGRALCTVCGAALNEDGTCPKSHLAMRSRSADGWMQ